MTQFEHELEEDRTPPPTRPFTEEELLRAQLESALRLADSWKCRALAAERALRRYRSRLEETDPATFDETRQARREPRN